MELTRGLTLSFGLSNIIFVADIEEGEHTRTVNTALKSPEKVIVDCTVEVSNPDAKHKIINIPWRCSDEEAKTIKAEYMAASDDPPNYTEVDEEARTVKVFDTNQKPSILSVEFL